MWFDVTNMADVFFIGSGSGLWRAAALGGASSSSSDSMRGRRMPWEQQHDWGRLDSSNCMGERQMHSSSQWGWYIWESQAHPWGRQVGPAGSSNTQRGVGAMASCCRRWRPPAGVAVAAAPATATLLLPILTTAGAAAAAAASSSSAGWHPQRCGAECLPDPLLQCSAPTGGDDWREAGWCGCRRGGGGE